MFMVLELKMSIMFMVLELEMSIMFMVLELRMSDVVLRNIRNTKRGSLGVVGNVVKLCFFTILSMYISLETDVYNAIPCQ